MKKFRILLFSLLLILVSKISTAKPFFDCNSPRTEVAGYHNMVLFGSPDDTLYAYHLPLFAGKVNGTTGHVLMHIYQGLWNVKLDEETKKAYDLKFYNELSTFKRFPFFTLGPQENRFKVPEMICIPNFSFNALTMFGHIEENPNFPAPIHLINQLSNIRVVGPTLFARKFDGSSISNLTYFIFGSEKQMYMVHYLTDDENGFDQIVAVAVTDPKINNLIIENGGLLVNVPIIPENNLTQINSIEQITSPNNKWKLPSQSTKISISMNNLNSLNYFDIQIIEEFYFNNNEDLKK